MRHLLLTLWTQLINNMAFFVLDKIYIVWYIYMSDVNGHCLIKTKGIRLSTHLVDLKQKMCQRLCENYLDFCSMRQLT